MSQLYTDPTAMVTSKTKNLHVSQCNVCGLGVFQTQKWVFSRRPLGICHAECLEETVDGVR